MSGQTKSNYADGFCVHELFEQHVARDPQAVAVVEETRCWSYAQVNERANRLARYLRERGVGPDVRVAILMHRGVDIVVAILATWKAGGAYVPLDPRLPVDRLRTMLETSAPAIILTHANINAMDLQAPVHPILHGAGAMVIDVQDDSAEWVNALPENLSRAETGCTDRHLAYVIYTSGSTGKPKGVMVEWGGLGNLVRNQIEVFRVDPTSRVLQFAPFGFDASVSEIGMALCAGAALCIANHETPLVGVTLVDIIRRFRITHLTAPPSVLGELPLETRFDSMVTLSLAGEVPSEALVGNWAKTHRLLNGYGPTEATVCSSVHEYGEGERASIIGRALANTQTYILDEHGQPVPVGVTGEIFLAGAGVARGYEGEPALTAERFVPNPFTCRAGARMYRTGDLARYQKDGSIEYVGRNDRQIKLRGLRIELAEIESRLLEHPRVLQVAVLLRKRRQGDVRLVVYVVESRENHAHNADDTPLAPQLRRHLARVLPEYMLPAAYVQLERMPLNANGKIDRAALPELQASAYAWRQYEAPQGPIEIALADIWADVLDVPNVARHDNFFELGGHSFLAVRVVDRMLQQGLHADVKGLYSWPTVASLALAVDRVVDAQQAPENRIDPQADRITAQMLPLVTLTPAEIDRVVQSVTGGARNVQDIYPLAPLQEGILFHHRVATGGDAYHLWTMYRFQSRSQVESYIKALQGIVDRHDILRTGIVWEQLQEPVQVVWRRAILRVDELDLDTASDPVQQVLVNRFNRGDFLIDLQCAPLMRLIVTPDPVGGGFVVMEVSHHMILDHVTQGIIQNELRTRLLQPEKLLSAALAYREFITRVRRGFVRAEHEAFFTEMLETVEEATAPFGIFNVKGNGADIVEAELDLDSALARRLRQAAQDIGVSPATLHHLAWSLVLSRLSGHSDVVFGTVLSGRSHGGAAIQHVAGLCANTLPIRLIIDERSCVDVVRATHRQLTQLMAHEQAPLALTQRCSGVAAPAPLFTAILNYRYDKPELAGLEDAQRYAATSVMSGAEFLGAAERTHFPFTLSIDDWDSQLRLKVQVDAQVDPKRICAWMSTALLNLVEALEQRPHSSVQSLDVMPAQELQTLLVEWSERSDDNPRDVCIHELFEASADRFPDAEAVVHQTEALGFAQLNEQANQLARHLRDLGIAPEQRVALCVERGIDMVVAILAILKAGGCYVPLDPAYPTDRLEYMLRDATPAVLLTQSKVQDRVSTRLRRIAAEFAMPVVDMDTDKPLWVNQASDNLSRTSTGLNATHLAYVIYTSGSTGNPKGIEVEHRSATHFIQWGMNAFGPEALRQTQFSTSINFDPSVLECFATLASGGTAVIVGDVLSGPDSDQNVTFLNAVPSATKALLDARGIPVTTRTVVLGGEAVPPSLVERIFRESDVDHICNAYGPTESGYTTYAMTKRGEIFTGHIGRPIGKTRLYILDTAGKPTPIGVAGEIYVGGHGLARGYHKRPALTAERFLPDGFSCEPGARMYRTGDLGRYREDGNVEFLGRSDYQVKYRGFRIELGEIEAKILEHPTIAQTVVLLREDQPGEKRLVAYVVGKPDVTNGYPDGEWPTDVLRSHLSHFLTNHMVPAVYVALESLPVTPNGKLNRAALPKPDALSHNLQDYETPLDDTEAQIAGIWMDLLGVGRVGRRDNFFELGGHSLLAMVVAARLRTGLGVEIALPDLLARPVLCDLAMEIRRFAGSSQTKRLA